MFDIGFSELMLIGVVALIVIGPERLPKLARTAGAWLGRLNRYVSDVKSDIDREMRMEELRNLQNEMKASAQKYELMAEQTSSEVKREVGEVDKVIQAMARTDGGLSAREADKIRAEAAQAVEPDKLEPAAPGAATQTGEASAAKPDAAAKAQDGTA